MRDKAGEMTHLTFFSHQTHLGEMVYCGASLQRVIGHRFVNADEHSTDRDDRTGMPTLAVSPPDLCAECWECWKGSFE
jgi:hypothetical protein